MGLHSEASIHKKITDLARQLNLYLNHFPAHEKHALCRQIRESLYGMYGHMIEAQKRFHKKTALSALDIEHEKLRWFCFLAHELGYFEFQNGKKSEGGQHRFLVLSKMIDELGRMIGGWMLLNRKPVELQEGS